MSPAAERPAEAARPAPPHEPEIEVLRRIARAGLLAFRTATCLAGATAVGWAVWNLVAAGRSTDPLPVAPWFVWLCIGIPPLLSTTWLLGRGRWPMLLVGIALWFLPMGFADDHEYGFLARIFASIVAASVLLVWRTLFALTRRPLAPAS